MSFILAFTFIETENFAFLLTTLILGSFAKETILSLAGFYLLFCRREPGWIARSVVRCLASASTFFCARFLVLHTGMHYQQISGTPMGHVIENWQDSKWRELFSLTGGAYLLFLALAWRDTPATLKHLAVYLLVVLFVSSLLFGWLIETRNWMPLVFVLAVVGGRYFSRLSEGTPLKAVLQTQG